MTSALSQRRRQPARDGTSTQARPDRIDFQPTSPDLTAANPHKHSAVRPSVIGRRVLVDGMMGSGKSTFARALAARTGLPLIHLDLHYWKPGWVRPSDD